jgi:hypothetical protein
LLPVFQGTAATQVMVAVVVPVVLRVAVEVVVLVEKEGQAMETIFHKDHLVLLALGNNI